MVFTYCGLLQQNETTVNMNATSSTLLQLHLEYAAIVSNPIESLENVQKFTLTVCMKSWNSAYKELLTSADLQSLQDSKSLPPVQNYNGLTDFPDAPVHATMTLVCQINYSLMCHSVKHVLTNTNFFQAQSLTGQGKHLNATAFKSFILFYGCTFTQAISYSVLPCILCKKNNRQ